MRCPCVALSDSDEETTKDKGNVASPSTPVLIRSPQSRKFRFNFPNNASRSLCILSFPSYFYFRHKSANSITSFNVFDTACNCSLQRASLKKKGWLDKSDEREGIRSSCCTVKEETSWKMLHYPIFSWDQFRRVGDASGFVCMEMKPALCGATAMGRMFMAFNAWMPCNVTFIFLFSIFISFFIFFFNFNLVFFIL